MSHFDIKFQNFQIDQYLTGMLEMTQNSSVIMVTPLNNGQMNLKIKLARCYFRMFQIIFFTSFGYYFKGRTWLNLNFISFRICMSNISHFEKI